MRVAVCSSVSSRDDDREFCIDRAQLAAFLSVTQQAAANRLPPFLAW